MGPQGRLVATARLAAILQAPQASPDGMAPLAGRAPPGMTARLESQALMALQACQASADDLAAKAAMPRVARQEALARPARRAPLARLAARASQGSLVPRGLRGRRERPGRTVSQATMPQRPHTWR